MPRTAMVAKGQAGTPAKTRARKAPAKGESLICEECGLVLTVAEPCGCVDVCDVVCCEQPMKVEAKATRGPVGRKTAKPAPAMKKTATRAGVAARK